MNKFNTKRYKTQWYNQNRNKIRNREKTRAWKDYRNSRLKVKRFFDNLSFKDKIQIIKSVKPELYAELLENYNRHRLENDVKPQHVKSLLNSGQELNLGGIC